MIRSSLESSHERWANLNPLLRFLLLCIVLAALWWLAVKPGYRVFKSWRLEQNLQSAQKAVDEQRMSEARDLSLTVLRAGDPRIDAFRILEESTFALKDSRHGDIARALITHPESSDEDRLKGFRGIVMETPLGLVGQAWTALPPECRTDPRFAVAFAERLIMEDRLNEAATVLLEVPDVERTDELSMNLVRVLIGSGKRDGFDEAQRMIVTGINAGGSGSAEWLGLLEQIPAESLRADLLAPLRELLVDLSEIGASRRGLMLARMDYAERPGDRVAVLDAAVAEWRDTAPMEVARFLSDLGLYQRLLDTVPQEWVDGHPELFPLLFEAIARTGEWELAPVLLDASGDHLPKAEELAYRAITTAKTGGSSGAQSPAWTAALDEAKASPDSGAMFAIRDIAEAAGLRDEADMALVEAIRRGRGPLPLYSELRPLLGALQEQERENILLEVCAIYLSYEPGNPVLLTQYAYLACLNDLADPDTILKAIVPMAEAFPKEMPIQCVLATVYLCGGRNEKAAEVMKALELDPEQLPPAYRVAFLTTQVLNGELSKEDAQITEFPWKSLLPSERRKFNELIRNAGSEIGARN